jgi:hypothetical protein
VELTSYVKTSTELFFYHYDINAHMYRVEANLHAFLCTVLDEGDVSLKLHCFTHRNSPPAHPQTHWIENLVHAIHSLDIVRKNVVPPRIQMLIIQPLFRNSSNSYVTQKPLCLLYRVNNTPHELCTSQLNENTSGGKQAGCLVWSYGNEKESVPQPTIDRPSNLPHTNPHMHSYSYALACQEQPFNFIHKPAITSHNQVIQNRE